MSKKDIMWDCYKSTDYEIPNESEHERKSKEFFLITLALRKRNYDILDFERK